MALAALALTSLAACASAGGASRLGPDDGRLRAVDGTPTALAATWAGHDATVLVFWASTCPCVKRYEARVAALRDRYPADRVAFRYVASNADDDLADLAAARAAGREIVPFAQDPGGVLARTLGVVSTPTAVVIDAAGAVRFRGWIDNERVPGDPDREPWLEEAVDALLSGGSARAVTPFWGCTITRSLGERPQCSAPAPVAQRRCHP
jgi:thiol-disulfide isomerase/thioredoxin